MNTLRNLAAAALATTFLLPAQDGKPNPAPAAADAAAAKSAKAPVIGVVDFVKAIENYPKYTQGLGDIDKLGDAGQKQIDAIKKQIDGKLAEQQAVRGSEEARDLQDEIEILNSQGKALRERLLRKMEIERMRLLAAVYQDLEEAIAKVAKARGVGLVLRSHVIDDPAVSLAKLSPGALDSRVKIFERRQVWFASDELDLTADVINLLKVPLEPKTDGKDAGSGKAEKAPAGPKSGG